VKRTTDERDLRRSIVVLTPESRTILERMIASHLQQIEGDAGELLLRSLSDVRQVAAQARPEDSSERPL
jgi:DNA-binding MarR family transcriptional regulator